MIFVSKCAISFLLLILSLILTTTTLAINPTINEPSLKHIGFTAYEEINPNQLIYPLKQLKEQLDLFLKKDPEQKEEYLAYLTQVRLNELVYIANFKKTGFLDTTANRYRASIIRTSSLESKNIHQKLENKMPTYIKILETTRDIYPANSAYWMVIQQTIDVTRSIS